MTKKTRLLGAAFAALAVSLLFVSAALAAPPAFGIGLEKTAAPATLPSGGGDVTYSYWVTNTSTGEEGATHFQVVTVTDDKCDAVTFDSGDTDGDGRLDIGETWLFTCDATITETTTNTAQAFGCHEPSPNCNSGHNDAASDTASATVTVGTTTATIDTTGTSAAVLALVLLAIGGLGFLGTTNRLPKLPKFR
jgi:hypothetical protein